jgi:hypothetical protein
MAVAEAESRNRISYSRGVAVVGIVAQSRDDHHGSIPISMNRYVRTARREQTLAHNSPVGSRQDQNYRPIDGDGSPGY